MLLYPGGMERTVDEYGALFDAAGFDLTSVTPTSSMVSVIEGRTILTNGEARSPNRPECSGAAIATALRHRTANGTIVQSATSGNRVAERPRSPARGRSCGILHPSPTQMVTCGQAVAVCGQKHDGRRQTRQFGPTQGIKAVYFPQPE